MEWQEACGVLARACTRTLADGSSKSAVTGATERSTVQYTLWQPCGRFRPQQAVDVLHSIEHLSSTESGTTTALAVPQLDEYDRVRLPAVCVPQEALEAVDAILHRVTCKLGITSSDEEARRAWNAVRKRWRTLEAHGSTVPYSDGVLPLYTLGTTPVNALLVHHLLAECRVVQRAVGSCTEHCRAMKILCLGGGSGAEIVAFAIAYAAAARAGGGEESRSTPSPFAGTAESSDGAPSALPRDTCPPKHMDIQFDVLDLEAAWQPVVEAVCSAAQEWLRAEEFAVSLRVIFQSCNLLSAPGREIAANLCEEADIVLMIYALSELFDRDVRGAHDLIRQVSGALRESAVFLVSDPWVLQQCGGKQQWLLATSSLSPRSAPVDRRPLKVVIPLEILTSLHIGKTAVSLGLKIGEDTKTYAKAWRCALERPAAAHHGAVAPSAMAHSRPVRALVITLVAGVAYWMDALARTGVPCFRLDRERAQSVRAWRKVVEQWHVVGGLLFLCVEHAAKVDEEELTTALAPRTDVVFVDECETLRARRVHRGRSMLDAARSLCDRLDQPVVYFHETGDLTQRPCDPCGEVLPVLPAPSARSTISRTRVVLGQFPLSSVEPYHMVVQQVVRGALLRGERVVVVCPTPQCIASVQRAITAERDSLPRVCVREMCNVFKQQKRKRQRAGSSRGDEDHDAPEENIVLVCKGALSAFSAIGEPRKTVVVELCTGTGEDLSLCTRALSFLRHCGAYEVMSCAWESTAA